MDLTRPDPERQRRRRQLLAELAQARATHVSHALMRVRSLIAVRRRSRATSAKLRADPSNG